MTHHGLDELDAGTLKSLHGAVEDEMSKRGLRPSLLTRAWFWIAIGLLGLCVNAVHAIDYARSGRWVSVSLSIGLAVAWGIVATMWWRIRSPGKT